MSYCIQKPSRIDENITVYYTGNGRWSDDPSQKARFSTKTAATNLIKNPDGKNGGWTGATVVSA
jgi:hypothetical protein